jgi:hypothetical protein
MSGLGLADGALQRAVELVQGGRGEHLGESFKPVIDLIRGEPLELERADLRDEVLVDEDSVRLDGLLVEVPGAFLEPVADGFADRVGAALLLDPNAVTAAVVPEVDDAGVPAAFGVDRAVALSDQDLHRLPPFVRVGWDLSTLTQEVPRRPSRRGPAGRLMPRLRGMR